MPTSDRSAMCFVLLLGAAADASEHAAPPALRRLSGGQTGPSSSWPIPTVGVELDPTVAVDLKIDPTWYRSASQGPEMEEERLSPQDAEIDRVIDRAIGVGSRDPIIPQFTGSRLWAWSQWSGTILEQVWPAAVLSMLTPLALVLVIAGVTPNDQHPWVTHLSPLNVGWNYMLTLTTFVTTFFVGHAHSFWREAYRLTRTVQGRLNDIGLLCSTHAARDAKGRLTADAHSMLQDLARNLRLAHLLFWSDILYRRIGKGAPFRVLLSPAGLNRLCARGLMTQREHDTMVASGLPAARWYLVVVEWATSRIASAQRAGVLQSGPGFEQVVHV